MRLSPFAHSHFLAISFPQEEKRVQGTCSITPKTKLPCSFRNTMKAPDSSFQPDPSIAAAVESRHNAFADDSSVHNSGQPLDAKSIDSRTGTQKSKFSTDCKVQHSNSLTCIENNYDNKQVCQPFFDAYKKCRYEEHKRRLEMNAKMSGGGADIDGCIIC